MLAGSHRRRRYRRRRCLRRFEIVPPTALDPQALYEWVDSVPLSRPKRNITRDFADGGARA